MKKLKALGSEHMPNAATAPAQNCTSASSPRGPGPSKRATSTPEPTPKPRLVAFVAIDHDHAGRDFNSAIQFF
jgi:hypothetical protein